MDSIKLRKLLKEVKFPQGQGLVLADDGRSAAWSTRGGFAGGRAVRRLEAALKEAGFTMEASAQSSRPDGETVSRGTVWQRGDVTVRYHSHYGQTSRDNRFDASIMVKAGP